MAMHRAGKDTPPETAEEWCRIIRALTADDYPYYEPWQLVVDDITKPAFMQPSASSADKLAEYLYKNKKGKYEPKNGEKQPVSTPDQLDMLVMSRNHDLKSAIAIRADVDDWLFTLVSLQTMEGYGGSGNYGVSRMPSGYGNRSAFSFTPSTRLGLHFQHDLVTLLKNRETLLDKYPMTDSGIGLLWVVPWDGAKSETLLINRMEPFYIEVCRRVRLSWESGKLAASRANSDARRIVDAKGLVGDPWMPVSNNTNPKGTPPAFLGPRKFGYERVVDGLTSPDWKPPILLNTTSASADGDTQLVARGMVRGEGGTEGYHERVIPLRQKTIQAFGRDSGTKELGDLAKERIEKIGIVQGILRHAIATFATWSDSGRTNTVLRSRPQDNPLRKKIDEWVSKLDEIIDDSFFEDLQTEFEAVTADRESIRNQWLMNGRDGVVDHANSILRDAENSLPCPSIQRYKALVQADSVFWGRLHGANGLPFLFQRVNEEDVEWQNNNQASPAENPTETQMHLFE